MKEFKPTYKVRACIVGSADFFSHNIPSTANDSCLTFKSNEVLLEKKKITTKKSFSQLTL